MNNKKETIVVNIYRSPYDIYIGRAGKGQNGYFGNPFRREAGESAGATLERFKTYFYDRLRNDFAFKAYIHALRGKTLGCFCKPGPCHGDIIKEYLDQLTDEEYIYNNLSNNTCHASSQSENSETNSVFHP